jgi:uncharacterized membrane protein
MALPTARPVTRSEPYAPPLACLIAALGGGVILAARPRRDGKARDLVTLAGVTLLGVAAHRSVGEALRRAGTRRRAANIELSFVIGRPVEQVFAFCADFENFPRFIGALREVRDTGDGRSHWCVSTPSGGEIEWDAVITKYVTNSVIGWRSVARAPVETRGLIRFKPEAGRTCVKVSISYAVRDGSLIDALAALATPRRSRDLAADILRVESYLAATAPSGLSVAGNGRDDTRGIDTIAGTTTEPPAIG